MAKLEKLLAESELSEEEIKTLLKSKPQIPQTTFKMNLGSGKLNVLVVSDQHYGSKYSSKKAHDYSVEVAKKEKVDQIWCPGDFIEGMSNRDGHIYELDLIGTSNQLDYAINRLKEYGKIPIFGITGNHDSWAEVKANQGVRIGPDIAAVIPNFTFLGSMYGHMQLNDNVRVRLSHEGTTAYALSYSGQKRINAMEGGTKPTINFNGHIHKSMFFSYRNVLWVESGTLQHQTPFMAMKGTPAMVGFWRAEITYNKDSVTSFTPIWYPVY
jgi:predicted phosphodiesterase